MKFGLSGSGCISELLYPHQSDHTPILFQVPSLQCTVTKPFKFFQHVIDHPQYPIVVREAWEAKSVLGSKQFQLLRSLKLLKPILRALNRNHFSGITQHVKEQSRILDEAQKVLLTSPTEAAAREEHMAREKWNVLIRDEEKFFRQIFPSSPCSVEFRFVAQSLKFRV